MISGKGGSDSAESFIQQTQNIWLLAFNISDTKSYFYQSFVDFPSIHLKFGK